MPTANEVVFENRKFALIADSQLPRGRRGWTRAVRESFPTDRGVPHVIQWELSGPLGKSRARFGEPLGHDYSDTLETRYSDLLTSAAARNTLSLSSNDPPAYSGTNYGSNFGSGVFGPAFSAGNVAFFEQDRGQWFFHRGKATVQVSPTTPSIVETVTHEEPVSGSAVWKNKGVIGLGSTAPALRRKTVSATSGSSYETISISGSQVYAKAMTVGTDRLWIVRGDPSQRNVNQVRYTLDDFDSISNSFAVGDDKIPATGIGTIGPFTLVGSEVGAYSFTNTGKPVRLIEAVKDFRSTNNGVSIDSLWGWAYVCTELGLFAVDVESRVANPIGPAEGITGQEFEGAIDGYPTYVKAWKDSLWVAYLTSDGNTYIIRGMFGAETGSTGRPDWFPFYKLSSTEVHLISGSGERTNPTLLVGEGTGTLAYYTLGRRGRDIGDSNYTYSTTGGTWYGTTLTLPAGMRGYVRHMNFVTENTTSANYWQAGVVVDGGTAVNVGSRADRPGLHTARPEGGGIPLESVFGSSFKPQLTQTAASSSAPPQIRGNLTVGLTLVADSVEEHTFIVRLERADDFDALNDLVDARSTTSQTPISVTFPGERQPESGRYAFVVGVEEVTDIAGDGVQAALVRLQTWET